MFDFLGYGIGNTVLATVAIVIGVPARVSLFSLPLRLIALT